MVAVAGFFLLAGLATANVIVPAGWWQALVIVGGLASAVTLVLFFEKPYSCWASRSTACFST